MSHTAFSWILTGYKSTSVMFGFRSVLRFKSRVILTSSLIIVSVISLWYFKDFSVGRVKNTVKGSAGRSVSTHLTSSKQDKENDSCVPYKVPSELICPQTSTDLSDWQFNKRVPCSYIRVDGNPWTRRRKVALVCDGSSARLRITRTQSSADIDARPFKDPCLSKYIDLCCADGKNVPNVVHYVWFDEHPVRLVSLVSLLSVVRFMRPCLILFHGDHLPFGKHWDYFVANFPYVVHVKRVRPTHVYGQRLDNPVHGGDVMRLQALLRKHDTISTTF